MPGGVKWCDPCRKKRDAEDRARRGTRTDRGYDSRWWKYRALYLRQHPLCVLCAENGRTVAATVVDHIVPHKGDQRVFWDPKNHRALCKPCHDARVDEGDFGLPMKIL